MLFGLCVCTCACVYDRGDIQVELVHMSIREFVCVSVCMIGVVGKHVHVRTCTCMYKTRIYVVRLPEITS